MGFSSLCKEMESECRLFISYPVKEESIPWLSSLLKATFGCYWTWGVSSKCPCMDSSPSLAEASKHSPELSQGSSLVQAPIPHRSKRVISSGHHMFTLWPRPWVQDQRPLWRLHPSVTGTGWWQCIPTTTQPWINCAAVTQCLRPREVLDK